MLPKCLVCSGKPAPEALTPQHQPSPSEQDGESRLPMESPTAPSPTRCPTTPTLIVLLFIRIIFGCVFEYNLCENVRFGELNIEFKNVKYEFGDLKTGIIVFNSGFDYGALSPTCAPPSPAVFNFIGSYIELRENLDLEFIFGVECNGVEFDCNVSCKNEILENENENNYYGLCYPTIYPTTYPTPHPPVIIINFNNTDIELCKKLILDGVSGIVLCEYGFICNIINKINNRFEYGFIENFGNNGYYYQSHYPTPTSASIRAKVVFFNGIDNEIFETNILECIIGVVCNGIGYNCNVNEMIIGM